ncbi:MAG: hypothetical protein JOZ46_03910 [Candidatus Dormibacteraeota bacterium]|nr:hypothetical protein [Candidatus Dormibacteraeota bacterium]MBV9524946.1 hypothetical protein [Candidatus Dormibacteraeota bacterium]
MVAEPEHHHLPAWVRRAFGLARPILADELGSLSGDARGKLEDAIAELNSVISSGKFSQAFRYADLIALGERLLADQRREQAETARVQRTLEAARKRVNDQLRDAATQVPQETWSRLSKSLRSATDLEGISAVGEEVTASLSSARSVQERRREREIHRTRTRIQRSTPRSQTSAPPAEDWVEVLRRLQEEMTAGSAT